ncbi:hypothetical protein LTR56_005543 [Elasticomyces elasticus]|nr:hypothetical protein LTR22_017130 [Elasticomyces elasticus]KAK3651735.1 hypothetical protein LTR56_005543 [Elasticomyces elasticus]
MRLINTDTLKLHDFIDADSAPEYAILSHRWSDEEVSYKEWRKGRCTESSKGYVKIVDACAFAQARGQAWLWVDTCCIDKESSQDLSESINSMWYYYESAVECYAYLADVIATDPTLRLEQFRQSDLFNRGWTLQELVAPKRVVFVSSTWEIIGLKHPPNHSMSERFQMGFAATSIPCLTEELHAITRIPIEVLTDPEHRFSFNAAQRMSWMSRRDTARIEDMAYCLLGLFDINMPLLYGERHGAFLRLQREIFARTEDETILAWSLDTADEFWFENAIEVFLGANILDPHPVSGAEFRSGIFAPSPHCFKRSGETTAIHANGSSPTLTGSGIQITVDRSSQYRTHVSTEAPYAFFLLNAALGDIQGIHENPLRTKQACVYLVKLSCGHYGRTSRSLAYGVGGWQPPPEGTVLLVHYTEQEGRRHCSRHQGPRRYYPPHHSSEREYEFV